MKRIAVKFPCGGVESWERKEVGEGDQCDKSDEGIFEAADSFMIAWFEKVEKRTVWSRICRHDDEE